MSKSGCFTGNPINPKAKTHLKKKKQNNKRNKIIKCCGKQSCYGPKNIASRNKTLIKLKEKKEFTTIESTVPTPTEGEADENTGDPVENEPPAEIEPPSTTANSKEAPKEGANFYLVLEK